MKYRRGVWNITKYLLHSVPNKLREEIKKKKKTTKLQNYSDM